MQTLLSYLAHLAADPAAQQAFAAQPETAIAAADLSEADKATLRSRDPGRLHAAIGQEAAAAVVYASSPAAVVYAAGAPQGAVVYAAGAPHAAIVYAAGQAQVVYAAGASPAS